MNDTTGTIILVTIGMVVCVIDYIIIIIYRAIKKLVLKRKKLEIK